MAKRDSVREIRLHVQGMTWMGWVPKVMRALEGLDGVKQAVVSYPQGQAEVHYEPQRVEVEQMMGALRQAGYAVSLGGSKSGDREATIPVAKENIEPQAGDLVCYCFDYTRQDIEQDYLDNGRSLILERIAAEKRSGGCDCANRNPKGRWCLPDVRQVVDKLKKP